MSKKQHQKQVARARQKRQKDRFERRTSRNRWIILIMAVLMVLSLFAAALTQWLAGRSDPAPPAATEEADATEEAPAAEPELAATADRDGRYDEPFELTIDEEATYLAVLATDVGDITIELDPVGAPVATNNLVNLAQDGFYDGVIFHRVIEGFMIQGGDPTGLGFGGPGYQIEDEFETAEETVEETGGYPRGVLAMANTGAPNSSGSQFFIMHQDYPLPPTYTVFGEVVDGLEVVDAIATAPVSEDRPIDPVTIETITIEES